MLDSVVITLAFLINFLTKIKYVYLKTATGEAIFVQFTLFMSMALPWKSLDLYKYCAVLIDRYQNWNSALPNNALLKRNKKTSSQNRKYRRDLALSVYFLGRVIPLLSELLPRTDI